MLVLFYQYLTIKGMLKKTIHYFDRLEDKIRAKLSHFPLLYAFIGGTGVVLFWRGIWHTADLLSIIFLTTAPISLFEVLDGPISLVLGSILLLVTGVFVSAFIGSRLIITGLSGEKKLAEKTKDEIMTEEDQIKSLQKSIEKIETEIGKIETEITSHHPEK